MLWCMDSTRRGFELVLAWALPLLAIACTVFGVSSVGALGLGIGAAFIGLNREPDRWHRWSQRLLKGAVIGLGAGIDLPEVAKAGLSGFGVTFLSIVGIALLGNWMGCLLRVPRNTRLLISCGTAICGGSAIAAVAGVIHPRSDETAVSLGVVFTLNAVALVLFPWGGHLLGLSEPAFAWWAALAIHDTSSVVGAGMAYGQEALLLATTIKLARSIWIAPIAFWFAHRENCRRRADDGEAVAVSGSTFPWFVLGFLGLAALVWLVPSFRPAGQQLFAGSRHLLSATLFLIGAGLGPSTFRAYGWRPFALGLMLWVPTTILALVGTILVHR